VAFFLFRSEKAVEPGWELSLSRVMLAAWKRDEKLFRYFLKFKQYI
jgi:hypothetical protein